MKTCKHFGECGGCRFQDISYEEQLAEKENRIKELIKNSDLDIKLKPIQYSDPWFYRNKMEFSFADQGDIVCGLYSKNEKGKVVDIEECLIFSKDLKEILKAVKEFVRNKNFSVYNKYSRKGFLRNLIVRDTKFTNELMIGIVTTGCQDLDKEGFVNILEQAKLDNKICSIYWIVNDSLSDAVIFETKHLLYGDKFIKEKLGDFIFQIGIDSFFQVNPKMVAGFYQKMVDYTNVSAGKNVLDLFCGVGSIGIFLSPNAKSVLGVEVSEDIVDVACQNAKINNIDNIKFITADARRFLNLQAEPYKDIDILIINPPRSGLSNKITRAIKRLNPKLILYSSCNPDAFFRDLPSFWENYRADFVEPFDFFPHTPHMECLSILKKNNL
ncbi:MAG: 23S rRNA (uracil(1939)-C(5))-methyltransferase RlmD [Candidatus Omnitrophica bacterium]|nr:23S rRNA (uracil(1939)-C(5))-methyltransferase RlmD [Candidatus Omnitrophota bacterium]